MARRSRVPDASQLALAFDEPAMPARHARPGGPPVADAAQRSAALDPVRSFVVQAPAGSGKTGLLIQRYLALLARVRVPEEVVAITFTRKAAGEMRARVFAALRAARAGVEPQSDYEQLTHELARGVLERDRRESWGLEANPARLQVLTIDSLCVGLASRLPLLSRLGPITGLEEKPQELYREAARETLALLEEEDYTHSVAALLTHLDNDFAAAEQMLAGLMARREQWLRHLAAGIDRASLERALASLARSRMAQAREVAPDMFVRTILDTVRYAAANLAASRPDRWVAHCADLRALPGDRTEDLAAWRGIAELLLTKQSALRKTFDQRGGFPPASVGDVGEKQRRKAAKARAEELSRELVAHQAFVEVLAEIKSLPPLAYSDAQWRFIEALIALLPVAVAQLKLTFQRHGVVDFTETLRGAVMALGEPEMPTDLALALDYRIQHLLIDEFQDTSFGQYELLRRLTAGWQPQDGRTLFAVGDPMQSIYRFREAEVGLFLRVRERGIGQVKPEPLTLSVNFRSQAQLAEWVNTVFAQVLPEREDIASGAVAYSPSVAQEQGLPGTAVSVHPLLGAQQRQEAAVVVELVQRAQNEDADGTVALLVRNRTHLYQIVPLLKERGLRFRAVDIEPLAQRPAVRDLHALARALLHLGDRVAWLSLLRAPWCGLRLEDLEALAADTPDLARGVRPPGEGSALEHTIVQLMHDPDRVARLSADGQARLARVREALDPVIANRARGSLRRRVEGAWIRLGGPACAEDAVDIEDVLVFLGLLEELERGGDLEDLHGLDERLAALYALPDLDAPETLQVMTIHKSKGLEFDTVIVAGLGRGGGLDEPQLLQWLERPGSDGRDELLLAAITEKGRDKDPIYDCVKRLNGERERQEEGRLLYVAVTRARKRVHLVGATQVDEDTGEVKPPPADSLLARLWPALAHEFEAAARRLPAHSVISPAASSNVQPTAQRIRRLSAGWTLPPAPEPVPWRVPPALQDRELPEIEFSWAGETARHVGTVVHRFLQHMAEDGLGAWSALRLASMQPLIRTALRAAGVPAPELEGACRRVRRALEDVLSDARGRWVLHAGHAEAQSELRLTARLDDEIVNVAVDRTFVDEQGTRWIVDYKTGTHEGGSLEGFLDREQERYRAQLERYAHVMHSLDGRPVRVALYFPLLQAWREWEV